MKKRIIIGLVAFVAAIGVAQIIGGESAAMVVLYSFSGLITFALFDFLIYKSSLGECGRVKANGYSLISLADIWG